MKEIIKQGLGIATSLKFMVQIHSEELKEMTYLELGMFLTSNSDNIELVFIKLNKER